MATKSKPVSKAGQQIERPDWENTTTDPDSLQHAIDNAGWPATALNEAAITAHYPPADPPADDD